MSGLRNLMVRCQLRRIYVFLGKCHSLRNAVKRLSPAGPPPTHTTSKISAEAAVAYFLDRRSSERAHDEQMYDPEAGKKDGGRSFILVCRFLFVAFLTLELGCASPQDKPSHTCAVLSTLTEHSYLSEKVGFLHRPCLF